MVLAVGDDNQAYIFGFSNNPQDEIGSEEDAHGAVLRASQNDLRDLITAREIEDGFGRIVAFDCPCLDMQVLGEI